MNDSRLPISIATRKYGPRAIWYGCLLPLAVLVRGTFGAVVVEFVAAMTVVTIVVEVLHRSGGFRPRKRQSLIASSVAMLGNAMLSLYFLRRAASTGQPQDPRVSIGFALVMVEIVLAHLEHNRRVAEADPVPRGPAAPTSPAQRAARRSRLRTMATVCLPRAVWYGLACFFFALIGDAAFGLAYSALSLAHAAVVRLLHWAEGVHLRRVSPRRPQVVVYVTAELLGVMLLAAGLLMVGAFDAPLLLWTAKATVVLCGELALHGYDVRARTRLRPPEECRG